jgi:hypothetical protein
MSTMWSRSGILLHQPLDVLLAPQLDEVAHRLARAAADLALDLPAADVEAERVEPLAHPDVGGQRRAIPRPLDERHG